VKGAKDTHVETWEALPQAAINRECESFHERLQMVILYAANNNFNGDEILVKIDKR